MTDSELIWKFLEKNIKNDHPAVYLYACGNLRSPITAVNKVLAEVESVFCPPYKHQFVTVVIKGFLDNKKKLYSKGLIKVKPLY